jgi:phenylacetic acid degradation operon negative regulatory protein
VDAAGVLDPGELRPLRDRLRVRLSWLGFGSLGNGLWISPHDVAERVREIGEELGVTAHLELFRGRTRVSRRSDGW